MFKFYETMVNKYYGILRIKLIIVLFFCTLSAFGGGLGLIFMDGLGMPKEWLTGSPFDSFFWPGMILFFIVGGTNLLAGIVNIKKHKFAPEWTAVAGFGLLIWIFTEIYMIKEISWMQTLYFVLGIILLIFSIAMLRAKQENK